MANKIKHFKHSYAELAKVGRKYYSDDNFCTVVGLAVACDLSFGKARAIAERTVSRRKGKGLKFYEIERLYESMGKALVPVSNIFGATLGTVAKGVPAEGRYFFLTRSHCAVSREGILEDWSAKGSRHRVLRAFKIVDVS
jgi:hypothetical protein